MDQRIKQSGSEPTYILQIYMIFVNKDDKNVTWQIKRNNLLHLV